MRSRGLILLILLPVFSFSLSLSAWGADCAHTATTFKCVKYLKNYDGDTLTVEIPGVHPLFGEKMNVRVRGIDSPEIKGKGACEKDRARAARRLAENLLEHAKQINLVNVGRDKYFRILADVQVDGRGLSELLIKNHLAVAYNGETKPRVNWCQMAATRDRD